MNKKIVTYFRTALMSAMLCGFVCQPAASSDFVSDADAGIDGDVGLIEDEGVDVSISDSGETPETPAVSDEAANTPAAASDETATEADDIAEEATEETSDTAEETTDETADDADEAADISDAPEETTPSDDDAPAVTWQPVELRLQPGLAHLLAHGATLPPRSLNVLKTRLEDILRGYDGEWSIYVMNLENEEEMVINDVAMPSASVLKLFILGSVYDAIETGRLTRTAELVDLMANMIKVSSNEAANRLIALLGDGDYAAGVQAVNEYIQKNGYTDATRLYNPFQDESLKIDPNHVNHVSAWDTGLFLERVYHRILGPRKVCNEIEDWMLSQQNRSKIPAGLPEGTSVGNKTGETDSIESDTAVVYSPGGDYIVCILSTGWEAKDTAIYRIRALSAEIYDYFNDPDYVRKLFPLLPESNQQAADAVMPVS